MCSLCEAYRENQMTMGVQPFDINGAGKPGYMQPSADVVDRHLSDGCEPVLDEGEWATACDLDRSEAFLTGYDPISMLLRMAIPIRDHPLGDQPGCDLCDAPAKWVSVPILQVRLSAEEQDAEFYCSKCMALCQRTENRRQAS
jgi:hypothetical protein